MDNIYICKYPNVWKEPSNHTEKPMMEVRFFRPNRPDELLEEMTEKL
jgi:hypothetical protein